MTAEKCWNEMVKACNEFDTCQRILEDFDMRGVTDNTAFVVIRVRRNAADRYYKELREQYAALTREAFAAVPR